jgi:hypothetical protein
MFETGFRAEKWIKIIIEQSLCADVYKEMQSGRVYTKKSCQRFSAVACSLAIVKTVISLKPEAFIKPSLSGRNVYFLDISIMASWNLLLASTTAGSFWYCAILPITLPNFGIISF